MQAKVLDSVRHTHLIGLVGKINGERWIGENLHYHMTFDEYPGVDYHFLSDRVEIVDEDAEV